MDIIASFPFPVLRFTKSQINLFNLVSVRFQYFISGKQNKIHVGESPCAGVGVLSIYVTVKYYSFLLDV